jgi:hypothetical protein
MRRLTIFAVLLASDFLSPSAGFAQSRPSVHDVNGFMAKGAFTELDPEMMKHRFSLREVEKANFNSESTEIHYILAFLAKCEKLGSHVEEPLEVQGKMPVFVPPNAMGDEAYTTCFYAFNFNGLGLSGVGDDLVAVRPEKHAGLPPPGGTWNREQILSTQLFRLGYLKPDPILRQYQGKLGGARGHAVLEQKSNVVIVADATKALESLRAHIDAEIMEAMGMPASEVRVPSEPRPPCLGAIASKEAIHFYLLAFARSRRIPLASAQEPGALTKHYPEADLWTNEQGYESLAGEYRRINEFVPLARETGGPGWDEGNLDRAISPGSQRRMSIRFGVVNAAATKGSAQKGKKAARKR